MSDLSFTRRIRKEFPLGKTLYLNTGSCGRKPLSVLQAVRAGEKLIDENPTKATYETIQEINQEARGLAATLLGVDSKNVLLSRSTRDGLHLIMHSFLLNSGDQLLMSNQEHESTRTIARHLKETRGVDAKVRHCDPFNGSEQFCSDMLKLVTPRTKLVVTSEIQCYTGWRPNLDLLIEGLAARNIPLLIDGAHVPGQRPCQSGKYPLWVGSGHKWLGGPNETGFAYVAPHLVKVLKPVTLGPRYFDFRPDQLIRFEPAGTVDIAKTMGLAAACRLQLELNPTVVANRQENLVSYLRQRLSEQFAACQFRSPDVESENSSMLAFYWPAEMVKVDNLMAALDKDFDIWTQPDLLPGANPKHGLRISCHASLRREDIDRFIDALKHLVKG